MKPLSRHAHCALIVEGVKYDLTFTGLEIEELCDGQELNGDLVNIDVDELERLLIIVRLGVWLDLKPNYTLLTTNCVHFVQSCLGLPTKFMLPSELYEVLTNKHNCGIIV